jgi:glycosyltransferase involved in cell wall biosynthesis
VTFSVIVCAFNEEQLLPGCLHSLLQQSFPPHELIVINNASTDRTAAAASIPGIRVVDEPRKGLVVARETGRRVSTGDVLVYVDADCRAPSEWLGLVAKEFSGANPPAAVTGPYRFYDWDVVGRVLVRMYDYSLAVVRFPCTYDVERRAAAPA